MKIYYFGYGGHAHYAEALRPTINDLGMELVTIHEHDNADIKWNRETVISELRRADIIICPTDPEKFPAKSQNKLCQALSLGKPVVCSSLDSYKAVEEQFPGCCLFADTLEGWREKLQLLRDNEQLRSEMSQRGLVAAQQYSLNRIAEKWLGVLQGMDKVDIVIPTYNNPRGLKLCLDSIRACTKFLCNMIVVNNGDNPDVHAYLQQQNDIIYVKKDRMTFAQAVNVGIKAGSSKYVMILNDDVIVSKGWLTELVKACGEGVGAVGPLSNCDKGWLHQYNFNVSGVELLPGQNTFEQIEPIIPEIYDFESPYHEISEREWIAFYCTLIPRVVIEKVGILNERYINSGEDTDLCTRIRKMGYRIIQNYRSFVFHFGAVSRRGLEQEDKEKYHEEDRRTQLILREVWGKPRVMLYSGPSFERWDFRSVDSGGIGGSETWQVWVGRELSKLGYQVISFCDCPESGIRDGDVEYLHFTQYPSWIDQNWVDYFISSRTTDTLRFPVRAGKIFIISHDIWLLSQRNQTFVDRVTRYSALSEWHKKFFAEHHGVPEDKVVITANGIDFDRFDSIEVEKNPYRFHWSSSWDRGLDNVLYLWPFIRERIPEAELHVFYGCHTWKASCLQKNDQAGLKKIAEIEEAMNQPGVYNRGRVGQKELAAELKKSSLLSDPQWFSESFYITGIEAQYAGVPVICNRYAGVTTTFHHPEIGDTAVMLGNGDPWWPYSKEGREAFLEETTLLLTDNVRWKDWVEKGRENAKRYSWANVALMWDRLFKES